MLIMWLLEDQIWLHKGLGIEREPQTLCRHNIKTNKTKKERYLIRQIKATETNK